MEEAAVERRRGEERAERERQVLEKLKKVSVNGPSTNGAAELSGASASGVNGPKGAEWEREANARAEAEQAQLKEERMRLFDGSRPLEAAVKETVQKNLELCAAAISHVSDGESFDHLYVLWQRKGRWGPGLGRWCSRTSWGTNRRADQGHGFCPPGTCSFFTPYHHEPQRRLC